MVRRSGNQMADNLSGIPRGLVVTMQPPQAPSRTCQPGACMAFRRVVPIAAPGDALIDLLRIGKKSRRDCCWPSTYQTSISYGQNSSEQVCKAQALLQTQRSKIWGKMLAAPLHWARSKRSLEPRWLLCPPWHFFDHFSPREIAHSSRPPSTIRPHGFIRRIHAALNCPLEFAASATTLPGRSLGKEEPPRSPRISSTY